MNLGVPLSAIVLASALLVAGLVLGGVPLGRTIGGPTPRVPSGEPSLRQDPGALGRGACEKCHPSEFASHHASHHRSMTRRIEELRWDGKSSPTLPVTLSDGDRAMHLRRAGARVLVRGPDLHALGLAYAALGREGDPEIAHVRAELLWEHAPEVEREVALVTGSHHYLVFWVSSAPNRELRQLPFVYLLRERAWAPRREVFLQPPDALPSVERWNAGCIQCHTTRGEPHETEGHDEATGEPFVHYASSVAELGIGCEACHGLTAEHAARLSNPIARYAARKEVAARPEHTGAEAGQTSALGVVNPSRLASATASAICGQCHGYFVPTDVDAWWEHGFSGAFAPGDSPDALTASRTGLTRDPELLDALGVSRAAESIFWADGSVRVGGREYDGLTKSACYLEAPAGKELGCIDCHSMHDSAPNDQLRRSLEENVDAACIDCHRGTPEHSGHRAGSVGSQCVNCHMPKTSYALLGSIRSHRVGISVGAATDPPSACVLCHVDRTADWLDEQSSRLFPTAERGTRSTATAFIAERNLPLGYSLAVTGDAALRAILAASLGTRETSVALVHDERMPVLQHLTKDPYPAVRRVAARSLGALPKRAGGGASRVLDPERLTELDRERDDRPVVISE